jgi:nucleoside-diphosphate-sugar epimerase
MNSKTKIWISGSRGFLGKNLKDFLLQDKNYEIKCLSNNKEKNISKTEKNFFYLNFENKEDIQRILDENQIPDIFIHLGWGEMENPHSNEHMKSNITSSKNLIEVLFKAGLKKFIFLGSMTEYGNRSGSLLEEMPSQGTSANYARGKKKVAIFGFENAKITKNYFIHIRLSYVYGPITRKDSLIQTLFEGHQRKSDVFVGSCQQFRDYIHVSEAVEGIKRICNINQSVTINLGSGKSIKLRDFVELFWKYLGGESKKLHFDSEPHNSNEQPQPNCYLDLKKLKDFTNWSPTLSTDEGIVQTINELDKVE